MGKTIADGSAEIAEHTLVCLSASPSNVKIIKTAAKMASAFGGGFTALYVQTPASEKMDEESKARLQANVHLAEQLGANIMTVYGEDISYQIAEFARLSRVTRIIIGRSNVERRHFWSKTTLTEKLIEIAPNLEIHIIPDNMANPRLREKVPSSFENFIPYPRDMLITLMILLLTTLVGNAFYILGFTDSNIITVYILGVLLTSLFTRGYACGLIGSFISVVLFNFFFTMPRWSFNASDSGYLVTFAIMLVASIITGTLASKLKSQAKLSAQAAYKTQVLLDTDQILQRSQDDDAIFNTIATQLTKLLNRSIVMYAVKDDKLSKGSLFPAEPDEVGDDLFSPAECAVAEWVYQHNHRAGATTDIFEDAKCLYMAIRINSAVYGVVGIHLGNKSLDSFETNILLSILGECALALDDNRNAKEKEIASILAENEQLRANLLRAISHDLRTPLTSISGNASNLLSNYDKLDEQTRVQVFTDIFDDSQWLISLVENLLSVTRIEENRMHFNMSVQLMDEVIDEALKHISRKSVEHHITAECSDDLLLARMDAHLIVQVIINLVDNAVKYTPAGSDIKIFAEAKEGFISVSVADNGNGISDAEKPHIFEMFYTGDKKLADSRRSLGLGLPLCRSIIKAHGGKITITDNVPKGCIFTFTIPSGEVNINE